MIIGTSSLYSNYLKHPEKKSRNQVLCKKDFYRDFSDSSIFQPPPPEPPYIKDCDNKYSLCLFKRGEWYDCEDVTTNKKRKYQIVDGFSTMLIRYWNIPCNINTHRSGGMVFLKSNGILLDIPKRIEARIFNEFFYSDAEIRKMKISKLNGN